MKDPHGLTIQQCAELVTRDGRLGNCTPGRIKNWLRRGHLRRDVRGGIEPASLVEYVDQKWRPAGRPCRVDQRELK
jgi:hypothetical protein